MNYYKKEEKKINKKYYNLFLGLIFGLLLFNFLNPEEGKKPIYGSHLYLTLNRCYHIHHWFLFLIIHFIIIVKFPKYKISFISGFLIGGILNGLSFNDYLNFKC
jgi:hypothetical protein